MPGGEGKALVCVVGRELCLFLRVDAEKVPPKQRSAFVAMAVRRAAPFNDAIHGVAWMGSQAAVWYWSRRRIADALGAPATGRIEFIPEALLTSAEAEASGAQLLALAKGYEGRAWKAGRLVASRWWLEAPGLQEWHGFCRGAGLPVTDLPQAAAAPVQAQPWSIQPLQGGALSVASFESWSPRLLAGIAVLATLMLGFELGAIGRSGFEVMQAQSAATSLDEPLRKILTAREQTDQNQTQINELLQLRASRGQLELIAELTRLMADTDWRMKQWQQPAPGRIEATLALARPDLESLVSAWEASPMFEDVSTDLSGRSGEVTIKARVSRHAPEAP